MGGATASQVRTATGRSGERISRAGVQPAIEKPAGAKPRGFTAVSTEEVLKRLAGEIGRSQFERYFDGQMSLTFADGRLDVTVATSFLAQLIDRRFGAQLRRAAIEVASGDNAPADTQLEVRIQVDRDAFPGAERATPAPAARERPATQPRPRAGIVLCPRYKLDTYLVGTSNRLAHNAAVRLTEDDAAPHPLFLHGTCGLGKTHLLQGVAARFLERRPGAGVRYTTAEAFTNEFIVALKHGKIDQFRRAYRHLDLLCLDDVHFLQNKEATQNELLFTFDSIGLDGSRVVLASDEHPRDIKKLSEKLVSRFMAGAVVRIETPDPDLRERLIRHFTQSRRLSLDDAAVKLLVERSARSVGSLGGFGGSVREIEGLMNQVEAIHRLLPEIGGADGQIGVSLVRRALGLNAENGRDGGPAPALRPRRPIPPETIVSEVCRFLAVDLSDFMGKGRHARVVLARSLAAFLSRKLTTLSFPEIARAMGRSNHSTIITAHRRLERQIEGGHGGEFDHTLVPGHPACTMRELADTLARQVTRAAAGI